MECLDEDTVLAFVDGGVPSNRLSAIEAHLGSCPTCLDLVAAATGPSQAIRQEPLARGTVVGRYVILGKVGRGGMGEVHAAYDPELDRRIALKMLHERLHVADEGDAGRARLVREAKAIARVSHPNVVVVHDVGTFGTRVFIAMEFVEGETLATWMQAGPRAWPEVRAVFLAAGRGLAAAHAAGLVHRDFKPQNVMVGHEGAVRVMDFGLARIAERGSAEPDLGDSNVAPGNLGTLSGGPGDPSVARLRRAERAPGGLGTLPGSPSIVGTPAYMSPEQLRAEPASALSDQFSFCLTLYEALYGERAFAWQTFEELARAVTAGEIRTPPPRSRVPSWLRRVLVRGLARDPAARHRSMDALLAALERDPARARRRTAAAIGAAAVLVAGGAIVQRAVTDGRNACAGAAERLAGAWEVPGAGAAGAGAASRRVASEAAFRASGRPHASSTWQRVAASLDRYASAWTGMYTDACQATRVRGDQSEALLDLRMTCLEARAQSLRALTDLFAAADGATVDKAVDAALALPPVDACADTKALQAAVPPPADPIMRARVEELRGRLAVTQALHDAGRTREAMAGSAALVSEARALGYGPLTAAAQLQYASSTTFIYDRRGEPELRRAVYDGQAAGQDEMVAAAAVLLVYVSGSTAGNREEGWRWDQLADATLRRLGGHDRLWGWLFLHRASLLTEEGRHSEALAAIERTVSLYGKALGPDHPDVAMALNTQANVLVDLARPAEALAPNERAMRITDGAYGPANPYRGVFFSNRGEILVALGRHEEAERALTSALEAWDPSQQPTNLAFPLTALGQARLGRGDANGALAPLERALALRSGNPTQPVRLHDTQLALARALWDAGGDRRRALSLARAAARGYGTLPSLDGKRTDAEAWLAAHAR